ncbi:MAG: antibiotic biosynthesis monooxygenase [Nocardioides sp.]
MLSVVVRLRTRPERRQEFLEVMLRNASDSLHEEPGCRRFDVTVSRDDPDAVLLYETYDDDAAFAAHRAAPHYAVWQASRPDLIVPDSQTVELFETVGYEDERR